MFLIRNCPAFCDYTRQCKGAYAREINKQFCSGNGYCFLKQIFRMCEDEALNCDENKPCEECEYCGMCSSEFASQILKKFDIEPLEHKEN